MPDYTGPHGELNFEADFVSALQAAGWKEILKNKTEKDLIENWKEIIFERNRGRLNDVPLSDSEMEQVLEKMRNAVHNGPCTANRFITDSDVEIRRDTDSMDADHAGLAVILDIFHGPDVASGTSRYQIVEQPIFEAKDEMRKDRRGDVMLLINGMPLIHIELKTVNAGIDEAYNQIRKYAGEGVFSGFFGLIQIFWCMTPEDAFYFANPGEEKKYNDKFRFRWGDKDNRIIKNWRSLITGQSHILSIPEAHQMIAYYCAPDMGQNVLLACRSYQYHSIREIVSRTAKQSWGTQDQKGGYCAVTTGGGKTLTTFKAGQMIVDFDYADKVVFVVDRDALNNQSLKEYNNFADDKHKVTETKNTWMLYRKLQSNQMEDRLIMTTIQKLSRINDDSERYGDPAAIEIINRKRVVFIFDEAHRSQAGAMHGDIKTTFPNALFFGFTGTPIFHAENKNEITENIFGKRLSFYSMAHGIRDKNVLGFLPTYISTYSEKALREEMAKRECGVTDVSEIKPGSNNDKIWRSIMRRGALTIYDKDGEVKRDADGIPLIGYEDYFPSGEYDNENHRKEVVKDILENYHLNQIGKYGTHFHGILATSSIEMACAYWEMFREENEKRKKYREEHEGNGKPDLHVTALFDPNINENKKDTFQKEEALNRIVTDYNKTFGTSFSRKSDSNFSLFKADLMNRLAHKDTYVNVADNECIDIVIVVDQLLTGYDSKRVNILYLDKIREEDGLIQTISRTNRVYGDEKPYGLVRFYRKPKRMERNFLDALKTYCDQDTEGVVADNKETLIDLVNDTFSVISRLFSEENIDDFGANLKDEARRKKFKKEFVELERLLTVLRLQGVDFGNVVNGKFIVFPKITYIKFKQRYLDLLTPGERGIGTGGTFVMNTGLTAIDGDIIDYDYLEKHFRISIGIDEETVDEEKRLEILEELKKDIGTLSERDQKIARKMIAEIEAGTFDTTGVTSMRECIAKRREEKTAAAIKNLCDKTGMDEKLFSDYYGSYTIDAIDQYKLKTIEETADMEKVKEAFGCKNRMKASSRLHEIVEDVFDKKNVEEVFGED